MPSTQQSPHFPDSFYRVNVKGIFVKDDKILLLKESPKLSGQWELPGGGLNFGEDIHEGLKRLAKMIFVPTQFKANLI